MEQNVCGSSSGASTPKTKRRVKNPRYSNSSPRKRRNQNVYGSSSGASTPKTKRRVKNPRNSDSSPRKRRNQSPRKSDSTPRKRRNLNSSFSDSPRCDSKITTIPNYGSEDDSDKEEEEVTPPFVVPRVARMFMDEEDVEVEETCDNVTLEWLPQSPQPSNCVSTAASPTPILPSPIEPSNKFQFEWRAISMPQIEPHLRREPFSQISGPTVSFTKPYEAFISIWDNEIMEVIVRETNIYALQVTTAMLENGNLYPHSRITHWRDTNVNELYVYFAMVLAMGMVIKNRIDEYWNSSRDIFSTPGFSTEMSYDRFVLLSKCLHFNNNKNLNSAMLTGSQAKLFKIKPIIDHLNCKFSKLYNLSQNVALDESLTMWKGWLDINQFIPNKAATVGIKTYEVCESQTGYLWRFEVHAGQDTLALQEDDPVSGGVPALVLRLLNGLEHKGHTIWMDNYYNSPSLARELKVRGFDCVGTLRTNRKFVPSEFQKITKNDMIVGQVLGCTSGDVDIMVWRDRNRVALISTYHGLVTTRCGDTFKPTVVQDYNANMGGVDRKDQLLAMYPIERRKTTVWYKKFFRRLLNVSVLNSYILLKDKSLAHRNFRKALITELLAVHKKPKPTIISTKSQVHCPAPYPFVKSGKSDRLRRKCAVCPKRSNTYCKVCNVAMCIYTCYETYHTLH
ncbi:piggyBac transposable element-derived protein 4 isoform X4 [Bombyx mori]|uniref:PiggyBac transposable element-derived protein domain-containing protein n=1 Tax=Bombyx mori TaxID=7091 RepID=A0A8R2R9L7_BOMMO|nr:piggyBac transposable element-derived protein 4-like isoform X2 [Bombyx mori]